MYRWRVSLYYDATNTDKQHKTKNIIMKLINYSEKSVAVIGDETKPLRKELMKLGGRYNPHLNCGAGWIFSLRKFNDVAKFVRKHGGTVDAKAKEE